MAQQDTELNPETPPTHDSVRRRRSPLKRLGCAIVLAIWFTVLLTPCFFIVMATQGEITISLGDIPGQSIRIWLINEARERGLAVSRPVVNLSQDNRSACVQTNVNFLLWQGEGKPTHFCECYTRPQATGEWVSGESNPEQCIP